MAYDNNVPLATDLISATQQPIHDNYAEIDNFVNVNHVGFNVVDQGKHKFVTLPVRGSTPVPLVNEINIFSRTSAFTGDPELCVARSTGQVTEMTSIDPVNEWAFTSSGLLLKWGSGTVSGVAASIVYPAAGNIPTFSTVFNVMITVQYPSATDENKNATIIDITNPAFFRIIGSQRTSNAPPGSPVSFFYLAVGSH